MTQSFPQVVLPEQSNNGPILATIIKQNGEHTRMIPVAKWSNYHIEPSRSAMRNHIFYEKTNGFEKFNVVYRLGRKVLIDEANFFKWLTWATSTADGQKAQKEKVISMKTKGQK